MQTDFMQGFISKNPGLWNEMDKRLHEWAIHNGQGIAA